MTKELTYAGIGARRTPIQYRTSMEKAASSLAKMGFILHSGAAQGADESFELGCNSVQGRKRIFLPFKGFRRHQSEYCNPSKEARIIASTFHPNWENVGNTGRNFHARNVYQVLGFDMRTPVCFVLCWTPNGKHVGGTGQALRMADHYEIPILNFAIHSQEEISERILEIYERNTE
ncbi:DprA-like DNA recombination-mediator protein [Sulfitobacter phage phiCB2047-B]|uniref:DNA recombination-mediator protein A n=1 Tax=Sulfitobacter phage phiCB2047-B TaxID=754046 RepID=M4PRM8_9CAUD|nr:DprA-like DNA recombination-mediator protein [Sulfitobacter phage phiCB2047-B]AGH07401.1 hypothetical protein SUFG_00033 [Sulfitobacter phage phiCB2047-B]